MDVNGTQDVYEYEPSGVGDCTCRVRGVQCAFGWLCGADLVGLLRLKNRRSWMRAGRVGTCSS